MSGEGVVASARVLRAPHPITENDFYAHAARRVKLMLPEYDLSPALLSQIDLALHQERCAHRARLCRPEKRQ